MALFEGFRVLRHTLKETLHSLKEVEEDRNQDIEVQKRAWGSNTDLEQQQQSTMPNFSRPHNRSQVQGYKGRAYTEPPSIAKSIANSTLRFCQFAFALAVAGLYGVDLQHASEKNVYMDSKWVFAEVVAALGAATYAAYLLIWCCVRRIARPALTSYYSMHFPLFLWEILMCLIWVVLFGIFGNMYLSEDPEGDSGIVRMKHAVWVDLVNWLLWMATMVWSGLRWWQGRIKKNKGEGAGTPSEPAEHYESAPVSRQSSREERED